MGGASLADNSFSLEVDDDGTAADAEWVQSSATTIAGHATDAASTAITGDAVSVDLWVTLAAEITYPDEYTGTVTLTISY